MTIRWNRRRMVLLGLCSALAGWHGSALAADADQADARVRAFYDVLLENMKRAQRTPVRARYEKLEPAVRSFFDLATMTRIAVGPAWTALGADDRQALQEQFARLTIATYASRFDAYSGERFEVDPAIETRGENRVVHSTLVQSKASPIALNYLMHSTGDGWKAIDVYLSGTISELATRRSEFGTLLRSGGPSALIDSLRQRADKLLTPVKSQ